VRAVELRAAGLSYDRLAIAVGYANRGTACNVLTQALAARQAHSVDTRCGAWNWPAGRPPTPPCGHELCRAMSPRSRRSRSRSTGAATASTPGSPNAPAC